MCPLRCEINQDEIKGNKFQVTQVTQVTFIFIFKNVIIFTSILFLRLFLKEVKNYISCIDVISMNSETKGGINFFKSMLFSLKCFVNNGC